MPRLRTQIQNSNPHLAPERLETENQRRPNLDIEAFSMEIEKKIVKELRFSMERITELLEELQKILKEAETT
jgi:hypothetical protein